MMYTTFPTHTPQMVRVKRRSSERGVEGPTRRPFWKTKALLLPSARCGSLCIKEWAKTALCVILKAMAPCSSCCYRVPSLDTTTISTPPFPSQVDLGLPVKTLKQRFPMFPSGPGSSVEVVVEAGQMLYLPAGGCMP